MKQRHGYELFPYLKALKLQGHEALAPVNFPTLCKVANTRKRRIDRAFCDYKCTKESLSTLTDREVEDAISKPPLKKKTLSKADADALKEVFGLTDQEIGVLI